MSVFVVVCDDYESPPFRTREIAERAIEGIEKANEILVSKGATPGCSLPHHVEEREK